MAEGDDLAVLLQDAIAELQASRKQTEALLQHNKKLADQNSDLADKVKEALESSTTRKQTKRRVEVSVRTKNFIHSVHRGFVLNDEEDNWKLDERFDTPFNKGVTQAVLKEVHTDLPGVSEEEILNGCQVYFKSLSDDHKRKASGGFSQHRIKQKKTGRLKHKLKIRKIGLDDAALQHKWSATHKQRLQTLLQMEYMSSESSAEESDEDSNSVSRSVMKVKKIVWLKRKYRDAFHLIDTTYYNLHKKSRDKLKKRVQGENSSRSQPPDCPKFAVKPEFREDAMPLNDSTASLNTSFESNSD